MVERPWAVPIEKNLQTRIPMSTHEAKFGMLTRSKNEKTSVRITMYASGFRSDQRKPSTEFLYRTLKSF
jgi:hypothetical protein